MTDMTLLYFDKPSKMASPTPAPGDCYGDGAAGPRAGWPGMDYAPDLSPSKPALASALPREPPGA